MYAGNSIQREEKPFQPSQHIFSQQLLVESSPLWKRESDLSFVSLQVGERTGGRASSRGRGGSTGDRQRRPSHIRSDFPGLTSEADSAQHIGKRATRCPNACTYTHTAHAFALITMETDQGDARGCWEWTQTALRVSEMRTLSFLSYTHTHAAHHRTHLHNQQHTAVV